MKIKYNHIVSHRNICKNLIKSNEKLVCIMSNLQTHYHFQLELNKMDQHTGGTSTKHRKDNRFQTMELPCQIS